VPETESVSLQACECFKAILMNRGKENRDQIIPQVIGKIIDILIELIPEITYEPFFEI